ncbi:MAG: serine/threonine-protein kinase [Pseudonocardia sp.]
MEGLFGRGGMGAVYRAFDAEQGRIVALKVLPDELSGDEEYRRRFRREARIAARLTDPHVVPVHRHGEIDGRLFLDMRLVGGPDLATVLADGPLPAQRAVGVVEQVARALDAAHGAGLVHRDVKPSNVFLSRPPRPTDRDFVYLGDFGIARGVDSDGTSSVTATGATVGTWAYMAPERFAAGWVHPCWDVYSLACVLYECLTGQRPFPTIGLPALMHAHLYQPPPAPSVYGAPRAFDAVVARGMAKDPASRFASAGELADAASAALVAEVSTTGGIARDGPTRAGGPTVPVHAGRPPAPTTVTARRPPPPAAAIEVPPAGEHLIRAGDLVAVLVVTANLLPFAVGAVTRGATAAILLCAALVVALAVLRLLAGRADPVALPWLWAASAPAGTGVLADAGELDRFPGLLAIGTLLVTTAALVLAAVRRADRQAPVLRAVADTAAAATVVVTLLTVTGRYALPPVIPIGVVVLFVSLRLVAGTADARWRVPLAAGAAALGLVACFIADHVGLGWF